MRLGLVLGAATKSAIDTYKQIGDQQQADADQKLKIAQDKATADTMSQVKAIAGTADANGNPIYSGVAASGTSADYATAMKVSGGDASAAPPTSQADAQARLDAAPGGGTAPSATSTSGAATPTSAIPTSAAPTSAAPAPTSAAPAAAAPTTSAIPASATPAPTSAAPSSAPPTAAAPPPSAIPGTATSAPPAATPTPAAPSAADPAAQPAPAAPNPHPNGIVYQAPDGSYRVGSKMAPRTQDDVDTDRMNVLKASSDPKMFAQGVELQNSIMQAQLTRQSLQSGKIKLASEQFGADYADAMRTYTIDPKAGLAKLTTALNSVENHGQVQIVPTGGENAPYNAVIYDNTTGKPVEVHQLGANWKDTTSYVASLQDPSTMLAHQQYGDAQALKMRAQANDDVKAKAAADEALAAITNAKANVDDVEVKRITATATAHLAGAQADLAKLEIGQKTAMFGQAQGLRAVISNPTSTAEQVSAARTNLNILNGNIENDSFSSDTSGNYYMHQAGSGQTQIMDKKLKQFVPLNVAQNVVDNDADMVAGRIKLQQGQGYQWQYTVPGTPGGFSTLAEAKAHLKTTTPRPSAIPMDGRMGARGMPQGGG